jgi:hypothetical protein
MSTRTGRRGVTKNEIRTATGCSDRSVEDYVEAGLLAHPKPTYRKGHRDAIYLYAGDSITRVRIIRERLKEARDYREAAFELFLRGYDPEVEALRSALLLHVEQKAAAYSFRQRETGGVPTPYKERQRIERALQREADGNGYSDALRSLARTNALALNGVARPYGAEHGVPALPVPTYAEQRGMVAAMRADVLKEAAARTRQQEPNMLWPELASFREEDAIRALLPGHTCKERHSVKQAGRPMMLLAAALQLDASLLPDSIRPFYQNPWPNFEDYNRIAPSALEEGNGLLRYTARHGGSVAIRGR